MNLKVKGITNLLSGFYQDIVINETDKNVNIKISPSKLFEFRDLDGSYIHDDYSNLKEEEKVRKIIDSYLNNNTLNAITTYGRLKYRPNSYFAVNAYENIIEGYQAINRPLYLKINSKELKDEYKKIILKYEEDRIRHIDEILNCKKIKIMPDTKMSSYIIDGDTAYITLICDINSNRKWEDSVRPLRREDKFLELILVEFFKKIGYAKLATLYGNFTMEIVDSNLGVSIEMDERFMKNLIAARNKYEKLTKDIKTITIDEYLVSIGKEPILEKIKR